MNELLVRFSDFYQELNLQSVGMLENIYDENVVFEDPVGKHAGLTTVKKYFTELLNNTSKCEFDIKHIEKGSSDIFVQWEMFYQHPKVGNKKTIAVPGMSHLKTNGERITFQKDYYDMGSMIYEHLPLIGRIIKFIKNKMKAD